MSLERDGGAALCARVFDRLVEGDDLSREPVLAEHLGSCVTCFRALTELRDAPRLGEALRAEPPTIPRADARFWDDLAARTTDAAEAALRGATLPRATAPASARVRARRSLDARGARVRIISIAATLAAAAAAFVLVARRPVPATSMLDVPTLAHAPVAVGSSPDDGTGEEEADVTDLDAGALRRLLDRMHPHAPTVLTSGGASGAGDAADTLGEDEVRMSDELADLDGVELRRVAGSLEAGAW